MAELCMARAMRLVPQRHRFDAAWLIARMSIPFLRQTRAYREQQHLHFHGPGEIALHLILNTLSKHDTPFDPPFVVDGDEHFDQARARGKGVLVIGHHAALTLLMVRHFFNKGLDPVVITPNPLLRIAGTLAIARTIQPSQMFLVQLRSRLRRGDLVCAMPDRAEHHRRRTIEVTTPAGKVIIAPAIIELAARCEAELLFTVVRLQNRRLYAKIVAPSRQASGAASLVDEFVAFIRSCVGDDAECETIPLSSHP